MKRKYWYIIHHYECPVCGRDKQYRERVYEEPENRHKFHISYDWCDA